MSPSQPAVVTDAEVDAAYTALLGERSQKGVRIALEAAAAVRSAPSASDVTTRLTEAEDRVAKAEERDEKAEAEVKANLDSALRDDLEVAREEVVALTAKLDEARGVLRAVEWTGLSVDGELKDWFECPSCWADKEDGHLPGCRLAVVLALSETAAKTSISDSGLPEKNSGEAATPDSLAAEREAGRREGAAYVHAVGWDEIDGERRFRATIVFPDGPPPLPASVVWNRTPVEIRALRDTPAAPEPGETEGGGDA